MDFFLLTAEGKQAGPYSLDQIRAFWATGQVTMNTPCWTSLGGWKSIRDIADTINPHSVPQKLPPLPIYANTQSSDLAAKSVMAGAVVGLAHSHIFKRSSPVTSVAFGAAAASCMYQAEGNVPRAIRRFALAWVRALVVLAILFALAVGALIFLIALGSLIR